MGRFILALFCFFVLELVVLIEVGSAIGALAALSLLFLGMLVGATLVKLRFRQVVTALQQGRAEGLELIFLPLSGFLFIFPGFISDVLGLLLLIPPCQGFVLTLLKRSQILSSAHFTSFSSQSRSAFSERGKVIDVDYTEVDDHKPQH